MKTPRLWMMIPACALLMGLVLGGCIGGDDGKDGKSAYEIAVENGFVGTEEEWLASLYGGGSATPGEGSWFAEYCDSCHESDGTMHQASYDQLYQADVIEISNLAYAYSTTGAKDIVTFEMTKFGNDFDCRDVENLSIYFTEYTGTAFEMEDGERVSLKGTVTWSSATNVCTSTKAATALGDLSALDGVLVVFGRDETIAQIPGTRVNQTRYPYGAVEVLGTVGYQSAGYEPGCQLCHTRPFLKHGYELADVGVPGREFYLCKGCHLDNGEGGHFIWQLLVEDPQLIVTLEAQYGEDWEESGDARLAPYAYRTRLMNDVHMSHAMEFPYPQSMANCATCHEGKLGLVLTAAKFRLETCKSCHPMNGDPQNIMEAPALLAVMPTAPGIFDHSTYDATMICSTCHNGATAPTFSEIHTGYDPVIYTDDLDGTRFADVITVSIDDADLTGNTLTITFSASGTANGGSVDSADIVPTVLVGLYGQETKDFLVGPHARDIDDDRNLEFDVIPGESHPRFAVLDSTAPTWVVTADLSAWSHLIGAGNKIQRAEIAVIPYLRVALNAVSRPFNLLTNTFNDGYYGDIVRVDEGCNNCHDALGTTFHLDDDDLPEGRGGSIVVCRLCHITLSGGSHLEMQSRSIDSYAHAIHAFQPFDIGDIDFTDPVEKLHYEHHIGFVFPTFEFGCEFCHNPGTYDVPDQYGSMPGLLSASDSVEGRNIADVPEYVTGPAGRACGSCHRVEYINADDAAGLANFNQHIENYGYLWENDSDDIILGFIIDVVFSVYAP